MYLQGTYEINTKDVLPLSIGSLGKNIFVTLLCPSNNRGLQNKTSVQQRLRLSGNYVILNNTILFQCAIT